MLTLSLPSTVIESNFVRLLDRLAQIETANTAVTINFSTVEYWIPAAIVSFCANFNKWQSDGRPIQIVNMDKCPALTYLQRVDFLRHIGIHLPERFNRHASRNTFVEVQSVPSQRIGLKDTLATQLAECLAGTNDGFNFVFLFSQYALGEILNNIRHHAQRDGYVCAQYVEKMEWARIGVADCGIGIRKSFVGSPHETHDMTDAEALETAMTPWMSSKRHLLGNQGATGNRGIGLKMVLHMITQLAGEMIISSGSAWRRYRGDSVLKGTLRDDLAVEGVSVSLKFPRTSSDNFNDLVRSTNEMMALTPEPEDDIFFS